MSKLTGLVTMYRGLPRSIYVLFFARIINSLGSFVFPFLTMFLTDRLGLSESRAGLYIMLSGVSYIPGSIIGGKLADHLGRKKVLIISQFLGALCFVPCAFLGDSIYIPFFIIAADFFYGAVHPAIQAIATDLSVPENRKEVFSLLYLGLNLGFALGPLIAGFLYTHYIRWIFLGDTLTTWLSLILILLFVDESRPTEQEILKRVDDGTGEAAETGGFLRALATRPFLLSFVFIIMILNFVYAQMSFTLPLFTIDLFSDRGPVLYGSLMSFNAVVVILGTSPIIASTRRMTAAQAVITAGVLYALGFGMLYLVSTPFPMFLSAFIWTIGEILAATNTNVYIANHTPISHRGRFNALFPIIMGIGHSMSPALMGPVVETLGSRMIWPIMFFLAAFGTAALIVMNILERKKKRAHGQRPVV
ncbi:MAG: MFS transporter [Spirochaetales bacterium]|nr:MFS transporter [Spirochaetales bacterium]